MDAPTLTQVQTQVLAAVVEGYRAREGLKDRLRALNEWEIARRAGLTDVSYAEFFEHPVHDELGNALSALQRLGLVSLWERGVKYDTFIPTPRGETLLEGGESNALVQPETPSGEMEVAPAAPGQAVLERLDEIIRLLRSVDAKLDGN